MKIYVFYVAYVWNKFYKHTKQKSCIYRINYMNWRNKYMFVLWAHMICYIRTKFIVPWVYRICSARICYRKYTNLIRNKIFFVLFSYMLFNFVFLMCYFSSFIFTSSFMFSFCFHSFSFFVSFPLYFFMLNSSLMMFNFLPSFFFVTSSLLSFIHFSITVFLYFLYFVLFSNIMLCDSFFFIYWLSSLNIYFS
jgi:hypothetical protein